MRSKLTHIILASALLMLSNQAFGQIEYHTTITGLQGPAYENAIHRLDALKASLTSSSSADEWSTYYLSSKKEIKKAIKPFGYFKATINSQLKKEGLHWRATFTVKKGPRLRLRHVDITITGSGQQDTHFTTLLKDKAPKRGQGLNIEKYENVKLALMDSASRRGYFEAKIIRNTLKINLKHYYADITVHFSTGPRYRLGDVTFSKTPLFETFLHKFVPFKQNQGYTAAKVDKLHDNLNNTGYFSSVDIDANYKKAKDHIIPVHANLIMAKQKRYMAGIGYGTDTGARGLAGVEYRYLTPWGDHFKAQIQGSQIQNQGELEYIIPGMNPLTDHVRLSGKSGQLWQTQPSTSASKRKREETGSEIFQNAGISYSTVMYGWSTTFGLNYLNSRYNNTGLSKRNAHFIIPNLLITKRKLDHDLNPSNAYVINVKIRGADKSVASSTSFFQTQIDAKTLKSLTKNLRIKLRGAVGYTNVNSIYNLPISLQFLEGGAQSIRGYRFQSLGPGKTMYIASAELQQRIKGDWFIVGYFDAGNVNDNFSTHDIKKGVGAGVLWLSPLGGIHASIARPLDKRNERYRFVFTMGTGL